MHKFFLKIGRKAIVLAINLILIFLLIILVPFLIISKINWSILFYITPVSLFLLLIFLLGYLSSLKKDFKIVNEKNSLFIQENEELKRKCNELILREQELISLNSELNLKYEEISALNNELMIWNDNFQEAFNELSVKQQEVIALNQGLTYANQKLENANNELNANQEEITALNEQLIALNTNLEEALKELREAGVQLIQQEKMASLGQLAAGIAHEINTPMGAISCNVDILKKLISKLKFNSGNSESKENQDLLIKLDELNQINIMACERIVKIVKSLKSFARLDDVDWYQETDINRDLDNSLVLLNNKIKNRIEVIREYGELPVIKCYGSQINQAFMNILVNAADAIESTGKIWVKTYMKDNKVFISIKDNGSGISQENINKIFNPGFTTKGVGVGTGLGLAITYNIIEKHHGTLEVKSEPGVGTEFIIGLPVTK